MNNNEDIIITDVYQALEIIKKNPNVYRVVSIKSPPQSVFSFLYPDKIYVKSIIKEKSKEVLFLEFDDITDTMLKYIPKQNISKVKLPTEEDCKKALNFLKKGGKRLVHCRAGISRSTAIVLGYFLSKYYPNYKYAIDTLFLIRPCASPNSYILKLMCKLLNILEKYEEILEYVKIKGDKG